MGRTSIGFYIWGLSVVRCYFNFFVFPVCRTFGSLADVIVRPLWRPETVLFQLLLIFVGVGAAEQGRCTDADLAIIPRQELRENNSMLRWRHPRGLWTIIDSNYTGVVDPSLYVDAS